AAFCVSLAQAFAQLDIPQRPGAGGTLLPGMIATGRHLKGLTQVANGILSGQGFHEGEPFGPGSARMPKFFLICHAACADVRSPGAGRVAPTPKLLCYSPAQRGQSASSTRA